MVIDVLVELKAKGIDQTFSYKVPKNIENNIEIGKRVTVPFGHQTLEGFIININDNDTFDYELKEIINIIDEFPVINSEMLKLGKYMSEKTLSNLISCYQTMLPSALKAHKNFNINKKEISYLVLNDFDTKLTEKQQLIINLFKEKNKILKKEASNISVYALKCLIGKKVITEIKEEVYRLDDTSIKQTNNIKLNTEQENVVKSILSKKNTFTPFLLHGVTGSGKTEVYMHIIDNLISDGKEALVLVPEISLTPQLVANFKKRFGSIIAILHSGLSDGEKYDEWRKIERKEVSIVIGARSAVFAPLTNIGIIIIDEEHSQTYKQENNPRYNAIDVALFRAKNYNCPIVLGSATPQIESYTRAKQGIYSLLEMKNRVNKSMPKVYLIDMKNEMRNGNGLFSNLLKEKINQRLKNNEQIILLLNRRGYSTIITCHNCGYKSVCPNCDIPLTYHKSSNIMRCHYCGYSKQKISICPECKSKDINEFGMGTEKLENLVAKEFNVKVIRMDVDTTSKKGSHERIIEAFKNHDYDILIGTQMIAKGLDFDNVTLVGVINGDVSLNMPDFRSGERTFQLLSQVAGRAGRGDKSGEVIIQGFNVDNYSIVKASKHDYIGFYNEEMLIRKQLKYPPYYNISLIKLIGKDLNELFTNGEKIIKYLEKNIDNSNYILGPNVASIPKINNVFYVQIIIKYKKSTDVIKGLNYINNMYKANRKLVVEIDINPIKI